jgi:multicomponent Na+:H+ antiporter subunit B
MKEQGMSILVKRITRITVCLIFLYGLYIAFHGHLSPGGGFAGGVIFALSLIHIVLAFGKEKTINVLSRAGASMLESAGALAFLLIGVTGFAAGAFYFNFLPRGENFFLFSSGTVLLSNLAVFVKVGAGLFAVFCVLALSSEDSEGGGGEEL